ncbi:MAG: SUMF1/EgtB/PvdO family nonheme iron enzyme, partial [Rivularia sp. ALOHA_DT_140]|nr:SUMF1/EgtB/PvdO family nonheme iron enzyme [Rivularia sp. ALOHA_DT_140]
MSRIKPELAQRRIKSFTKRFGEAHLYLAYHAAFPLALTPDLLYGLWVDFQSDIHGQVLGIPWIAVGDLLLSVLCNEVGHELYEMDLVVRNQLLRKLQSDERFGKQRINQLSNFLLEYVHKQLQSQDPDIQDLAKTQQWIALAYTKPNQAARELALEFSKIDERDKAELLRMASLTKTFAELLSEFQPLLIYARGMGKFARGDLQGAEVEFKQVLQNRNNIQVADINLPIPEQINVDNSPFSAFLRGVGGISRRRFVQWTGFAGVGLVTGVVTRQLSQTLKPIETVTVNAQGNIINRRNVEAKYFEENLGNNITLEMVQIPGGSFRMGSPADEAERFDNAGPQHEVTIPEFFMGR